MNYKPHAYVVNTHRVSSTENPTPCQHRAWSLVSPRSVVANEMSASRPAKMEGREYAMHMDANDPLKSFREKFLIPPKGKSSMNLPLGKPIHYAHWQLQTATMAVNLASTFAEIR